MKTIARSDILPIPRLWRACRPLRTAARRLHLPLHRASPHSVAELSDHLRRDIGREGICAEGVAERPQQPPH